MSLISLYPSANSFYKTSFAADSQEADRSRDYPRYLPRPDLGIVHLLHHSITMFQVQEAAGKLCHCNGCE